MRKKPHPKLRPHTPELSEISPASASLGIVIVSYNDPGGLDECLHTLRMYEPDLYPSNIQIVDNSDTRGVLNMLAESHPMVPVKSNTNSGFGAGNNLGTSLLPRDIILFLNPDVKLGRNISRAALGHFENHPQTTVLGVRAENPGGNFQHSFFWVDAGGVLKSLAQHFLNRSNTFIPWAMCTTGAALFVRREQFLKAGAFDENIFLYNEESDLWRRVRRMGGKWKYLSEVRIEHAGGGSTPAGSFAEVERLRSLEYYCSKYGMSFESRRRKEQRYQRVAQKLRALAAPR